MSIITEEYIDNYFEILIKNNDKLKNDETFVRKLLTQHLAQIPNGKLYKYRTCNRKNFKVLRENNIYIPSADSFKDTFDYTLNIELGGSLDKVHTFICKNTKRLMWHMVLKSPQKSYFENVLYEQYKREIDKYVTDDGELLIKRYEKDLDIHGNSADKKFYKSLSVQISQIMNNEHGQLDKIGNSVLNELNRSKFSPRKLSLIYCMTEDKNSAPMWENYAGGYQGFCIEYDFSNLEKKSFREIKNLVYLSPVIYKDKKPYLDMFPFFKMSVEEYIFNEKLSYDHSLQVEINRQLLYKHIDYAFEKEWRFAIKNENNFVQPFPFVSAIYMGKDITENNIKHLKVIAKKLRVPLYKQKVNQLLNTLDFEEVNI